MTLEAISLVFLGVVLNGFTFVVGLAVGISLYERKQDNDSDSNEAADEANQWHIPLDIGSAHRPRLRSVGGAQPQPKADSAKRQDR